VRYLKGFCMTASVGLVVITTGCGSSLVSGAIAPTTTGPSAAPLSIARATMTSVDVGPETTIASGMNNANAVTGKLSLMQLPYAESFFSAAGARAPRVVLVSFSQQPDSRFFPELLRTERSVDGGKTFTQLKTRFLSIR
jgi:hypothetical protein